jgi:hypoxanthine phosphoribosyltransferase
VHNPLKPIKTNDLSMVDVYKAMQRLVEDARTYNPNHIIAINRGGAIVGGWLAKRIGLEAPIIYVVNSDEPPGKRVMPQLGRTIGLSGRIYLVDDAQRKGEHMREAVKYLQLRYPEIQIRRAVLLQMRVPHTGPEFITFRATPCDFAGFFTYDATVVLPWDKE